MKFNKSSFFTFLNLQEGRRRRLAKKKSELRTALTLDEDEDVTPDRNLHGERIPMDLRGNYRDVVEDGVLRREPVSGRNCFLCNSSPTGISTFIQREGGVAPQAVYSTVSDDECGDNVLVRIPRASSSRVQYKTKYVCVDCGGVFYVECDAGRKTSKVA